MKIAVIENSLNFIHEYFTVWFGIYMIVYGKNDNKSLILIIYSSKSQYVFVILNIFVQLKSSAVGATEQKQNYPQIGPI